MNKLCKLWSLPLASGCERCARLEAALEEIAGAVLGRDDLTPLEAAREMERNAQAALAAQAENEQLKAELNRRQGDPVTRLHNICEALQEDAKESPFSREEWSRMDAEQVRLENENRDLRQQLAAAQAEIERLRTIETWTPSGVVMGLEEQLAELRDRCLAYENEIAEVCPEDCSLKDLSLRAERWKQSAEYTGQLIVQREAQLAAAERKLREDVPSFLRHCPGLDEIACVRAVTEFHKWLAAQADDKARGKP